MPQNPWPALQLRRFWYGLGIAMLGGVMLMSLLPVPATGVNDKFAHVFTYCVLSAWFSLLIRRPRYLLRVSMGLLGYGMLIELLQDATAYRQAEWADAVANGLGIGIGLLAFWTPLPRFLRYVDMHLSGWLRR